MAVAGGVLQLAVQVGDELTNQIPAFLDGGLAEQHGAKLGVGGAGFGGRAVSDLALQVLVAQAFPGGGDVGLVQHGLVVDKDHGQGGLTDPVAVGILVGIADELVVGADIGLEVVVVSGQGVGSAAPQHVALGIGGLGDDTLAQLAGTGSDDFHIDVGVLGLELGNARIQRIGIMGRVDDQLAGVVLGSLLGGSGLGCRGGFGLGLGNVGGGHGGGGARATGAQREDHAQNQKQCKNLFHHCSSS